MQVNDAKQILVSACYEVEGRIWTRKKPIDPDQE